MKNTHITDFAATTQWVLINTHKVNKRTNYNVKKGNAKSNQELSVCREPDIQNRVWVGANNKEELYVAGEWY